MFAFDRWGSVHITDTPKISPTSHGCNPTRPRLSASSGTQFIGSVLQKNANIDAAVNLEFDGMNSRVGVCLTDRRSVRMAAQAAMMQALETSSQTIQ